MASIDTNAAGRETAAANAFYESGRAHMNAGRSLDAQLCCQQALAIDPAHADTLHLMGLLSLQAKQHDHAVEWLSRAIRQDPKPLYLTTLGTALLLQGRGAEALKVFEKAIELKPDEAELWRNLGVALTELNRNDEAILSFQHALKLEPGLWDAANRAAILLHQAARFEDALVYLNLCDGLKPNHIQTLGLRSETLQGLQRHQEAFGDLERVHLLDPANADACNQMGNCLVALGRYDEASSLYDKAFALGRQARPEEQGDHARASRPFRRGHPGLSAGHCRRSG
jgi:tetratricopeptide (TPR) repeat protein